MGRIIEAVTSALGVGASAERAKADREVERLGAELARLLALPALLEQEKTLAVDDAAAFADLTRRALDARIEADRIEILLDRAKETAARAAQEVVREKLAEVDRLAQKTSAALRAAAKDVVEASTKLERTVAAYAAAYDVANGHAVEAESLSDELPENPKTTPRPPACGDGRSPSELIADISAKSRIDPVFGNVVWAPNAPALRQSVVDNATALLEPEADLSSLLGFRSEQT